MRTIESRLHLWLGLVTVTCSLAGACAAAFAASMPAGLGEATKAASHSEPATSGAVLPPIVVNNPGVLPPGSNPYGASYAEWSARWWQWAYSIPASSNPIGDPDGRFCGVEQSGPVWFLAGTSGGTATRSCSVPVGKGIFFPIVNAILDYPCPAEFGFEPPPGQTVEDFLIELAADFATSVNQLAVEIDGVSLGNLFAYRAASGIFTFTGDPSLQAGDPCITGTPQIAASDGYWLMLSPLSAGQHTIHFSGAGTFFGSPFSTEVTYNLTVASRRRGQESTTSAPSNSVQWGALKTLYR